MAATYFGISNVETFSGGTEATAFHPNAEARRLVSTPAARADCGVVNLRCANGTRGGAWVGVVQALAGRGERCGLPMQAYGNLGISACWSGQSFPKLSKCGL